MDPITATQTTRPDPLPLLLAALLLFTVLLFVQ